MSERDRHWLSKMEQKDLIQMLERNMPYTVATLGLLAYLSRVCCCCPESCLSGPTGVRGWLDGQRVLQGLQGVSKGALTPQQPHCKSIVTLCNLG